jgi:hypothetical protein
VVFTVPQEDLLFSCFLCPELTGAIIPNKTMELCAPGNILFGLIDFMNLLYDWFSYKNDYE